MQMSNTNNSNTIPKITCYAIGCNQNAETNVKVYLEKRKKHFSFAMIVLLNLENIVFDERIMIMTNDYYRKKYVF